MHPSFDSSYAPKYAVYGLGLSGWTALEFFRSNNIDVCCWDDDAAKRREANDAGYLTWDFTNSFPPLVRKLVISPGIPWNGQDHNHAAYRIAEKARQSNIDCICDVECLFGEGMRVSPAMIPEGASKFAVTGTNGKTSVVHWIQEIINLQEFSARAVGNNGVPVLTSHRNQDCLIFELSSYQLDLMQAKAFDRVMLLNISPDHLERYGTIEAYKDSKEHILDLLKPDSLGAVIGVDDPYCAEIANKAESLGITVIRFSTETAFAGGIYLENGCLVDHREAVPLLVLDPSEDLLLNNKQHMRNLTAVYAFMCRYMKVEDFARLAVQAAREMNFAHRQNPVAWEKDRLFIDDSKATNPIAAADALQQFRRIHWIAGGQAKAGGFSGLQDCFEELEAVYLIGSSAAELQYYLEQQELPEGCTVHLCTTLAAALEQLYQNLESLPETARTVLLSPGCASFDQFAHYVERGKAFGEGLAARGAKPFDMQNEQAVSLLEQLRHGVAHQSATEPEEAQETPTVVAAKPVQGEDKSFLIPFADWLAQVDKISITAILLLFGFGLVVQSIAEVYITDISFIKQVVIGSAGLCGMFFISMLSRRVVITLSGLAFLVSIILMILVPMKGVEIKGGMRWLPIPGLGFNIQPVELFKVTAVSVFALIQGYACTMGVSRTVRNTTSVFFMAIAAILIIIQPDFSQTMLMLAALAMIAILASELSFWWVLGWGVLLIPTAVGAGYYLLDHVRNRIHDYLYKTYHVTDQVGLALLTAKEAPWFSGIAEGGIRHWKYLSDIESDFVIVLIMQEFGKVIALFPIFLVLLVVLRCIGRMWDTTDIVLRFWQWGLVILLSGQTLVNIGAATGSTPATGMTFPLVSYGGSSLLGIFFCLGLLLFLSRDDVRKVTG